MCEGGELHHGKLKIEAIDKDNFVYDYSLFENKAWPETLERIIYKTKLSSSGNGGSVRKVTIDHVTKGDAKLTEEELKVGRERGQALFKAVEAYLLANPTYN